MSIREKSNKLNILFNYKTFILLEIVQLVSFTPDLPWLYLLIWGSVVTFLIFFGLIMQLTQRKKKKAQQEDEKIASN